MTHLKLLVFNSLEVLIQNGITIDIETQTTDILYKSDIGHGGEIRQAGFVSLLIKKKMKAKPARRKNDESSLT